LIIKFIGPLYNWIKQITNHWHTVIFFDWTLHGNYSDCQTNYSTTPPLYSFNSHSDFKSQSQSQSQSQSYVTTDGQSASLSWNRAPIWGLRPDFYYCRRLQACWSGALSLWRGDGSYVCHSNFKSQSHSQSYIATDGQSITKSLCRAPSGARDQIFITLWQLRSYFCGLPFLTRGRVCFLYMQLALASVVFFGSESLGIRDHILLSQIWDFLFVNSYVSQGHGGGIRTHLYKGEILIWFCSALII
jgi:hypothetical protein